MTLKLRYENGYIKEYVKKAQLRRPSEEEAAAPWVVAWLRSSIFDERLHTFLQWCGFTAFCWLSVLIVVLCSMLITSDDGMFWESDESASGSA